MRRLKDAPGVHRHRELVALPPTQRLFVQRWLELFDWAADVHFQIRPVQLAEAEAEANAAEGYHVPLLSAEIAELRNLPAFTPATIHADPVAAAERLAATRAAILHHPQYLFHALNVFLNPDPPNFEDRIEKLRQGWAGSAMQEYVFYFAVRKLRRFQPTGLIVGSSFSRKMASRIRWAPPGKTSSHHQQQGPLFQFQAYQWFGFR